MVRVRFAPSPTGSLHLGNALSAVVNRRAGDWMLLRIDDTDPARNVAGGEEAILGDLGWLEIDWDEGPVAAERASGSLPGSGRAHRDRPLRRRRRSYARTALPTYQLATVVDDADFGITHVSAGTTTGTTRASTVVSTRRSGRASRVRPPRSDPRGGRQEALQARVPLARTPPCASRLPGRRRCAPTSRARPSARRRPSTTWRGSGDSRSTRSGRSLTRSCAAADAPPEVVPALRGARDLLEAREIAPSLLTPPVAEPSEHPGDPGALPRAAGAGSRRTGSGGGEGDPAGAQGSRRRPEGASAGAHRRRPRAGALGRAGRSAARRGFAAGRAASS